MYGISHHKKVQLIIIIFLMYIVKYDMAAVEYDDLESELGTSVAGLIRR